MITIADILNQWQSIGVFTYLLPMLLIFAIVFGLLTTLKIFGKNKMVAVVIAIAISLLSLQFNFLGDFLSQFAPRFAVGITILISLLILLGLFIPSDERRYWGWALGAIAFVVAIVIVTKSFENLGWGNLTYSEDYVGWLIGAILFIGLIIAVSASGGDKTTTSGPKSAAEFKGWGSD